MLLQTYLVVVQLQAENIGQVEQDLVLRVVDSRCRNVALDTSDGLDFAYERCYIKDEFIHFTGDLISPSGVPS